MITIFVAIFILNVATAIYAQYNVTMAGEKITEYYIPIQTEIFTIQKSMERGQKYLNIISLYDNADLRAQLESALSEEIETIHASETKVDSYLSGIEDEKLESAMRAYTDFLEEVIVQFTAIQEYVDEGDFENAYGTWSRISESCNREGRVGRNGADQSTGSWNYKIVEGV